MAYLKPPVGGWRFHCLRLSIWCMPLAVGVTLFGSMPVPALAGCNDPPEPYVDWSGCDKRGMDLKSANLRRANLEHTNLMGADLSGADLSGAYMWSTYFWGANLRGTNFRDAETRGAYLKESYLAGAIWQDGRICGPASVDSCH
ncbi:MAG: pentapeptide repeat-containing protein [Pseudomonadota bacterium]